MLGVCWDARNQGCQLQHSSAHLFTCLDVCSHFVMGWASPALRKRWKSAANTWGGNLFGVGWDVIQRLEHDLNCPHETGG